MYKDHILEIPRENAENYHTSVAETLSLVRALNETYSWPTVLQSLMHMVRPLGYNSLIRVHMMSTCFVSRSMTIYIQQRKRSDGNETDSDRML
jgi:hypothetical protein